EARSSKLEARSSKLEARSSKLVRMLAGLGGLILGSASPVLAQLFPPQVRFSTLDSTVPIVPGGGVPGTTDYREAWADAKSPGDGRTYSVGTIEVSTTAPMAGQLFAQFSGADAWPAETLAMFTIAPPSLGRQVVMLQEAGTADQTIGFQRYYYGTNTDMSFHGNNARGISVWPAATRADTRIAICGETFDEMLPRGNSPGTQAPAGWPGWYAGPINMQPSSAGFIAMFDGDGTLQWSHQFFGPGTGQFCAITDVSVRVGPTVDGQMTDYVTFCGISTYGNASGGPNANLTLTVEKPFAAPTGPSPVCPNAAGGATNNGPGQWDGIVGRLSHVHSAPGTPATAEYLSILGGVQQDGLFGIADIDEQHFAVVGSTGFTPAVGVGNAQFPVTYSLPGACPGLVNASAGVVAVFRADPAALVLESSTLIGSLAPFTNTVARDILVQRAWGSFGEPALIVVGSTDDPNLHVFLRTGGLSFAPQAAHGGGVDGFVLAGLYIPAPLVGWTHGTYRGGTGYDYLSGVQGWNEFYDHFAVAGVINPPGTNSDIDVASFYRPPAAGPLTLLTQARIGSTGPDVPAAMGTFNATGQGNFVTFGLGDPAGGGVTVDPTSRVNVVGSSGINAIGAVSNYPVTSPLTMPPGPPGRGSTSQFDDAVRTAFDLLPPGVGRTDGTGRIVAGGPAGGYPTGGYFGGTTPECALTPFGHQIGLTDPQVPPATPRMLLDFEGQLPLPGMTSNVAIVVSRHSAVSASALSIVALQLGFPGLAPGGANAFEPVALPEGVLMWVPNAPVLFSAAPNPAWEAIRFPLTLPVAPATFTVQVVCFLLTPIHGGGVGPACPIGGSSNLTGSPGLWISY
ncbi:MAG TPA: hypothetical protein VFZ65_15945, partial [Planctomycetota bacterium]|nr:hypothetical protein [Planctomycetota bacterium]